MAIRWERVGQALAFTMFGTSLGASVSTLWGYGWVTVPLIVLGTTAFVSLWVGELRG